MDTRRRGGHRLADAALLPYGGGIGAIEHHSESPEAYFAHTPGLKVVTASRENTDANDLRKLGDFLRDKDPDTVAVLATATESKVTFVAVCGKNAVARGIRAGDLVRAVSAVTGGKGGGKPDSAMGGGSEVLKIDDALAIVDDFVAEKLGL